MEQDSILLNLKENNLRFDNQETYKSAYNVFIKALLLKATKEAKIMAFNKQKVSNSELSKIEKEC